MIQIQDCSKKFDSIVAVNHVNIEVADGEVFGLVGSNGAGKSTLLRMMAGIYKPDTGQILLDGEAVYENPKVKEQVFYVSDDAWFPSNYVPDHLADFMGVYYPTFDRQRYENLMKQFQLDRKRKISTFSKGMKKQLMMILGVSTMTRYLLCDEAFDGLDPVMRQAMKSLFAAELLRRKFTPVIASHNLRELEDICDHVGLLHQGGILLSRQLEEMKVHIHKIQCLLSDGEKEQELLKELDVMKVARQGSLLMITARGSREEILERIRREDPLFCEVIPLTLEEIFICETEVAGYEVPNIFF